MARLPTAETVLDAAAKWRDDCLLDGGSGRGDGWRRREQHWLAALQMLVIAVPANLAIRWVGLAMFDIPPQFPPLSGSGPTIFFTVIGVLGAVVTFAVIRRFSPRPERLFCGAAVGVLLLSLIPAFWLLGDGAIESFPGATGPAVGVLICMHVVTAAILVWFMTLRGPRITPV